MSDRWTRPLRLLFLILLAGLGLQIWLLLARPSGSEADGGGMELLPVKEPPAGSTASGSGDSPQESAAAADPVLEELGQSAIFGATPPPEAPKPPSPPRLLGLLDRGGKPHVILRAGDQTLWLPEGGREGDLEVLHIGINRARVSVAGHEHDLTIFSGLNSSPQQGPSQASEPRP